MDIFSSPASKKFVIFQSFGSREERGLQRTARVQTHTLQTDIIFLRHPPQTGRCEKPPTFNCLQSRYGSPDSGFRRPQSQITKNFLSFGYCENGKTKHLLKQRKIIIFYIYYIVKIQYIVLCFRTMGRFSAVPETGLRQNTFTQSFGKGMEIFSTISAPFHVCTTLHNTGSWCLCMGWNILMLQPFNSCFLIED